MLVLTRKPGEQIMIGDGIVITVLEGRGDGVRIGIEAPRGVPIQRREVIEAIAAANLAAAKPGRNRPGRGRAARAPAAAAAQLPPTAEAADRVSRGRPPEDTGPGAAGLVRRTTARARSMFPAVVS